MDMERRLDEPWVKSMDAEFAVHARKIAGRINAHFKLNRTPSIGQVKHHGEYTPAAMPLRGEQRLQASFPRHFQVIAATATVAKLRDCSCFKLSQKPLADHNFAPLCQELSPLPSRSGVVHRCLFALFH